MDASNNTATTTTTTVIAGHTHQNTRYEGVDGNVDDKDIEASRGVYSTPSSDVIIMRDGTEQQEEPHQQENDTAATKSTKQQTGILSEEERIDSKHAFHWIEQLIAVSDRNDTTIDCNTSITEKNVIKEKSVLCVPNGEEINAKNTLQSFDDYDTPNPHSTTLLHSITNDVSTNTLNGHNNENMPSWNLEENGIENVMTSDINRNDVPLARSDLINVQAMLVPSFGDVVDAQPVYSIIATEADTYQRTDTDTANTTQVQQKQPSVKYWWRKPSNKLCIFIGIVIVCIITGIVIKLTSKQKEIVTTYVGSLPTASPIENNSTVSPTFSPTNMSKADGLTAYINSVSLLGRNISIDGIEPEDIALRWLINDDPLFNTTESWMPIVSFISNGANGGSSVAAMEQFRLIQRYALLTLWFQQMNINGTFQRIWTFVDGWLTDVNECNWFGIKCSITNIEGMIVEIGVVTDIHFDFNNVVGTISADLGLLSMIQHVVLSSVKKDSFKLENGVVGTLPSSIGQWTALTYISIAGSTLTGPLPSLAISQWTALKYFDASDCYYLSGTVPSAIGLWTALTYFSFSREVSRSVTGWDITGTLPSLAIGKWEKLQHFDISYNLYINGTLPSAIGQWTELTYFDVSDTAITGTLPPVAIGQWTTLEHFDVSGELLLTGSLPSTIGQWSALTYFNAWGNAFTGTLPSDDVGEWTALTYFNVALNSFTGTIPTSIGNWYRSSKSIVAYFQYNQFTGTMPIEMCNARPLALSVDCTVNCTCCTEECTVSI